jgi:hypothetical protein
MYKRSKEKAKSSICVKRLQRAQQPGRACEVKGARGRRMTLSRPMLKPRKKTGVQATCATASLSRAAKRTVDRGRRAGHLYRARSALIRRLFLSKGRVLRGNPDQKRLAVASRLHAAKRQGGAYTSIAAKINRQRGLRVASLFVFATGARSSCFINHPVIKLSPLLGVQWEYLHE